MLRWCFSLFKADLYHAEASWPVFSAKWTNTGTCWEFELCMFPLWLPHCPALFCLLSHHALLGHEEDTERSFPEPRNRNHTDFSKIHYFSLMVCLALESIPHIGNPASLFSAYCFTKVITKAQEYLYKFWMSHQTFIRKVLWRKHS